MWKFAYMKETVGHIWIDDVITNETYEYVKGELIKYADRPNITLYIASPGGSVRAGEKIYHLLKNSGKSINTIVQGEASSMASFLAIMGPSKICNPSKFMIHNPQNGIEGTAEQMIQGANELMKIENGMAEAYSAKTKIPIDQIKEMMRVETVLTAQEAVDLGFIDEVIGNYYQAVALGLILENPKGRKHKKTPTAFTAHELFALHGIATMADEGF